MLRTIAHAHATDFRRLFLGRFWLAGSLILVLAIWYGTAQWSRARPIDSAARPTVETTPDGTFVRLSSAKIEAADLHATAVARSAVQETRKVPGRIGYNASHRLEVKLPATGVVQKVMALPGQRIERGDTLALVSSVEVGLARDDVNRSESDVRLAERERDWDQTIATNLSALFEALDERPNITQVEEAFADKILGEHRDKIISAYSKLQLAERSNSSTQAMLESGAISDRLAQERRSSLEVAAAVYKGACEQSRFEAQQQHARSQAAYEHAQRIWSVARQKLELLLGNFAEISPAAGDDTSCLLSLRSTLDGVVEDRFVSDGTQFTAAQTLFTIANTDTLWVSAQIFEREWSELSTTDLKELKVESPALPGHTALARVQFTSVGVSPETRAVPIVAELPNTDKRFKPGMFAWVSIPLGKRHEALVIPASAVMRHEQEVFVFVPKGSDLFEKRAITLGLDSTDVAEVVHGLSLGEQVVDRGAFFLKSELLLEGDEEP